MTEPNLRRLEQLVAADLQGATLVDATKTDEDAIEESYVVLVRRAQHPFPDRPFVTHRALLSLGDGRGALISGHYDLDLFEAVADYRKRAGRDAN